MFFRNIVILGISSFVMCGCAKSLSVQKVSSEGINTSNKEIVLLESTKWDYELKKVLIKNGFKVKNKPSVKSETKRINDEVSQEYDISETRYGLNQHPGGVIDICLINKHVKYDSYAIELIDTMTINVVKVGYLLLPQITNLSL